MSEWTHKNRVDGIRRQAQELIEFAYQRGVKAGHEEMQNQMHEHWERKQQELIEQGRNEAWEAARKIVINPEDEGFTGEELDRIFGEHYICYKDILKRSTASEVINKIRAYEQKNREEDERIKVGDEIAFHYEDRPDTVVFVTRVGENGFIDGMDAKGSLYAEKNPKNWTKTGRHLDEIAEVLKKMQEGE